MVHFIKTDLLYRKALLAKHFKDQGLQPCNRKLIAGPNTNSSSGHKPCPLLINVLLYLIGCYTNGHVLQHKNLMVKKTDSQGPVIQRHWQIHTNTHTKMHKQTLLCAIIFRMHDRYTQTHIASECQVCAIRLQPWLQDWDILNFSLPYADKPFGFSHNNTALYGYC